jgi:hypothetical protein
MAAHGSYKDRNLLAVIGDEVRFLNCYPSILTVILL